MRRWRFHDEVVRYLIIGQGCLFIKNTGSPTKKFRVIIEGYGKIN